MSENVGLIFPMIAIFHRDCLISKTIGDNIGYTQFSDKPNWKLFVCFETLVNPNHQQKTIETIIHS